MAVVNGNQKDIPIMPPDPVSNIFFYGSKEVRVIEIPLYISVKFDSPVKNVF